MACPYQKATDRATIAEVERRLSLLKSGGKPHDFRAGGPDYCYPKVRFACRYGTPTDSITVVRGVRPGRLDLSMNQ